MFEFYEGSPTSLSACSFSLIFLCTVAIIGRLVSRHISAAKFWWDDVLSIISLLNSYVAHIFAFFGAHHGVGRHVESITIDQNRFALLAIYGSEIHYPFSITIIKLTVLLFYLRLFGSRQCFKNTIYATAALAIAWFITETLKAVFRCSPISVAFLPDPAYQKEHCISIDAWLISMTSINILLDVCILVLPLFFIWTMHLSRRRKAGLVGIFMLGAFTIGASVARAYFVLRLDLFDITWSYGPVVFWSIVEISVGVICACLPTLPPFFRVLGHKLSETTSLWSKHIKKIKDKDKDLPNLQSPTNQKGEKTSGPNKKKTALQLTLGNASWGALDYKGFGHDITFKGVGSGHASPSRRLEP